jgi:hypothetical protein
LRRIDLARVVDLATQLEADAGRDAEALRRRDRTLGRALSQRADDATGRVSAWLDGLRAGPGPSPGERAIRAQRLLRTLLAMAGLGLGAATALAVFVGLQLLTLVATALIALPESWRRRVPGLAALQDVLRLASPGRWLPGLRRLLAAEQREAFDRAAGLARRHQRLYGDAQKWSLLVASQGFAVAFHVVALATAMGLVGFSDLAFGWSTTLEVDAERLHRVASGLALPWAQALPDSVPTRELIEHTRYFRGAGGLTIDPLRSAAWWRFLLACMACYGLAPRCIVLALAMWRQRVALARVFGALPGVAELQDRLDSRWVATAAPGAEGEEPHASNRVRAPRPPRPARVRAVRWSGVPIADERVRTLAGEVLGADLEAVVDGGAGAAQTDAALIADLAASEAAPLLLVKAWEPPILEVLDLLGELRGACGDGRTILVLPLARGADGALSPARDSNAHTWTRRLDAVGDPWLDVVTGEEVA